MNIYVSTGAFKTRDIREILNIAWEYGIKKIEISPGLDYCEDIKQILKENSNCFELLVHNYFPTPKESFALNLASNDEHTIEKSMFMCKNAVDFVMEMGIPFYSIHCGFCFDTSGKDLGSKTQTVLPRIPYPKARKIFIKNLKDLCVYAKEKGIKIAIENNVLADFARKERELLLGVTADDMLGIIEDVDMDNLGVLLDLAHAKVSGTFLDFSVESMIGKLRKYIIEVHASENDGFIDQNLPIIKNGDIYRYMKQFDEVPITLEVYNLFPEIILQQLKIANN